MSNDRRLSEHFMLSEFTRSAKAKAAGIDNTPPPLAVSALESLCVHVLEPIRVALGMVSVNSGYRCRTLNALVGGSATSQHCDGSAADIVCPGVPTRKLYEYIVKNLIGDFDQCILEIRDGAEWVHVSRVMAGRQRGMHWVERM